MGLPYGAGQLDPAVKRAEATCSKHSCGRMTNILGDVTEISTGPSAVLDVPTRPSGAKFSPSIGYCNPSETPSTAPIGKSDTGQPVFRSRRIEGGQRKTSSSTPKSKQGRSG